MATFHAPDILQNTHFCLKNTHLCLVLLIFAKKYSYFCFGNTYFYLKIHTFSKMSKCWLTGKYVLQWEYWFHYFLHSYRPWLSAYKPLYVAISLVSFISYYGNIEESSHSKSIEKWICGGILNWISMIKYDYGMLEVSYSQLELLEHKLFLINSWSRWSNCSAQNFLETSRNNGAKFLKITLEIWKWHVTCSKQWSCLIIVNIVN